MQPISAVQTPSRLLKIAVQSGDGSSADWWYSKTGEPDKALSRASYSFIDTKDCSEKVDAGALHEGLRI
jgi:hypothetical protein